MCLMVNYRPDLTTFVKCHNDIIYAVGAEKLTLFLILGGRCMVDGGD